VNVALLFSADAPKSSTLILVGKHAKVTLAAVHFANSTLVSQSGFTVLQAAARELFGTGKLKACVGIEAQSVDSTGSPRSHASQDRDSNEITEAVVLVRFRPTCDPTDGRVCVGNECCV
jgi:hypothetical protein